jgi:Protein of unknown function (DUF1015)
VRPPFGSSWASRLGRFQGRITEGPDLNQPAVEELVCARLTNQSEYGPAHGPVKPKLSARELALPSRMRLRRRGGRKRIVAPDGSELAPAAKPQPDGTLVKALARAWRWQRMLDEGVYTSVSEIGNAENISNRPASFLHISRPEIDLPPGSSPYSDAAYERGAENLARLRDGGVLVRDREPSFYVYRMVMNGRTQTGIAFAASVAAY